MSNNSEATGSDLNSSSGSSQSQASKDSNGSGFASNTDEYIAEYVKEVTDVESDEEDIESDINEKLNENNEFIIPKKHGKVTPQLPAVINTTNRYEILNKDNNKGVENPVLRTQLNRKIKYKNQIIKGKLPPIIIYKNGEVNYNSLKQILVENKLKETTIQSRKNTLLLHTDNKEELITVKNAIAQLQYFTYTSKSDKLNTFLIKRLNKDIEIEEVMEGLKELNAKVSWFNKKKNNWVIVRTSTDINLSFLKANFLRVGYSRIEWEIFKNNKGLTQCHRCQRWGHSAINCNLDISCMKCSGPHWTKTCTSEDTKCKNCSGEHYASSIECSVYIKKIELKNKNMEKFAEANLNNNNNNRRFAPAPKVNPWKLNDNDNKNDNKSNQNINNAHQQTENNYESIKMLVYEIGKLVDLEEIRKELVDVKQRIERETDAKMRKVLFKQFVFSA